MSHPELRLEIVGGIKLDVRYNTDTDIFELIGWVDDGKFFEGAALFLEKKAGFSCVFHGPESCCFEFFLAKNSDQSLMIDEFLARIRPH